MRAILAIFDRVAPLISGQSFGLEKQICGQKLNFATRIKFENNRLPITIETD